MRPFKNLINNKYGSLTVIEYNPERDHYGKILWKCKCDCGTEIIVRGESLISGNTTSCGCNRINKTKETNTIHGNSGSLEYYIWQQMKNRCTNPNAKYYEYYGGRGIKISDRWLNSFENFYADMGPKPTNQHSIDRIDNNGNYEPGNCRWGTKIEQMNNRSNNIIVNYKNKEYTLAEISRTFNINYDLLRQRVNRGWSIIEAIES